MSMLAEQVEGAGSFGAGLAAFLDAAGERVSVEWKPAGIAPCP